MTKLLFLLLLFCSTTLVAQPGHEGHQRGDHSKSTSPEQRAERFARIKAARQAFITEELELTAEQAAAFFPVYWALEKRMAEGQKNRSRYTPSDLKNQELIEREALTELMERRMQRRKIMALSLEAEDSYLLLLPPTKVIRLQEVERAFRKKLWDRTRKHKGN